MAQLNKGSNGMGAMGETAHVVKMLTTNEMSRPRRRPYASGVGFCPTQVWFHANRKEEAVTLSPALSLFQGIGNGVEERIVSGFDAHGRTIGKQVKLPNPPPSFKIDVGGYIDLVALDASDTVAAYEIKTTGSMPNEPKYAHWSQAMTYACLGGFDKVYVVYVSRSVQNFPDPTPLIKTFLIDVQDNLLEHMTTIVLSCRSMFGRETPPRPAHFRKSQECMFCDFKQKCWDSGSVVFKHPSVAFEERVAAERVAEELITLRQSFYAQAISNAKGGATPEQHAKANAVLQDINSGGSGKVLGKRTTVV